jgi:Protein of unknown function (DUF3071)
MQELRFVAVSEDGRYAVLAVPGRSARFMLPIDERLRAVALGQTSRLAQYEIEVESPLRPKEIQARIRAGETVEEIADAAGIAIERVRWFEGPVLAERAYVADQAQAASVRRHGDATPGPRLGEIVADRLKAFGADPEDAQWDAKKRGDGSWQVELAFITGGRMHTAEWVFDPRRRHVLPADDNAARMSLSGAEPPLPPSSPPGEATVTRLAPRLGGAPGHAPSRPVTPGHAAAEDDGTGPDAVGFAAVGPGSAAAHGNGGRARHERPAAARQGITEPKPPAPGPAPAPPVPVAAESRTEIARPPAAERSHRPSPVPQPAAQAPRIAAEEAARDDYAPVPEPAETPAASAVGQGVQGAPAEPAGEQPGRAGRKAARGRRSSVPSWDEIMFGSSRQRD